MATAKMDTVIRHLRRILLRQDGAGWTDGQLLASFIDHKDEAAFEALVRRLGPMVFGVCRRLLHNHHDAEDAFQSTFLVLARKASSVRPRERVANWLHGVALRTALKAKAMTAKRRGREKQVTEMPEPEAAQQDQWRDLQPLLDRELNGLPERYRLPILLCDLEGKTIKDAAQQLGWPQGTLAGRLARGRKLLAKRLANRGVALSAGSLAVVVSQNAVSAAVPTSLMSTTVKAAVVIAAGQAALAGVVPVQVAALMEGVLKTMFLTKLKSLMPVTMAMLAILVGVGVGLLAYGRATAQQKEDNKAEVVAPNKKEVAKSDKDQLLGKWRLISCKSNGEERMQPWLTDKDNELLVIEEAGGKLVCKTVFKDKAKLVETFGEEMEKRMLWADMAGESPAKVIERFGEEMEKNTQAILKLDSRTKPKTLDVFHMLHWSGIVLGIYKLDGDTLMLCWSKALTPEVAKTGKDRPTDFSTTSGDGRTLMVYKRQKETEPKSRDSSPVPAKKEGTVPLTLEPASKKDKEDRPPKTADQREYVILSRLVEAGADQPKEVLRLPKLTVNDGQLAPVHIAEGPQNLLAKVVNDEKIKIGTFLDVRVRRLEGNRVLLTVSFQKNEIEKSTISEIQILGNSVQAVQDIELHKPAKIVFQKDTKGSAQRWVEITVDEITADEQIAPAAAVGGQQQKGGEK